MNDLTTKSKINLFNPFVKSMFDSNDWILDLIFPKKKNWKNKSETHLRLSYQMFCYLI